MRSLGKNLLIQQRLSILALSVGCGIVAFVFGGLILGIGIGLIIGGIMVFVTTEGAAKIVNDRVGGK